MIWTAWSGCIVGIIIWFGVGKLFEDISHLISAIIRQPIGDVLVLVAAIAGQIMAFSVGTIMFIIFTWSGLRSLRAEVRQ